MNAVLSSVATPPAPFMGAGSLRDTLLAALEQRGFVPDTAQLGAAARLALLGTQIMANAAASGASAAAPRGIFMWGGVGRGKTLLLDLLVASLPPGTVLRRHQHAFLADLHRAVARAREEGAEDAFPAAVAALLGPARLLALDEFHAHDIADALILGRALTLVRQRGAALLFTANHPPAELWPDTPFHQSQAERYQPVAAFIATHCDLLEVDGGRDYRIAAAPAPARWWVEAGGAADGGAHAAMPAVAAAPATSTDSADSAGHRSALAAWLGVPAGAEHPAGDGAPLMLAGRPVPVRYRGEGALWFDFAALCGSPRSPADYLALALQAHCLAISGVPRFGPRDGDALRRFIWLIDAAYEAGVALAATAAAPWDRLLADAPDLARLLGRDLRRCESRLAEMTRRLPRGA